LNIDRIWRTKNWCCRQKPSRTVQSLACHRLLSLQIAFQEVSYYHDAIKIERRRKTMGKKVTYTLEHGGKFFIVENVPYRSEKQIFLSSVFQTDFLTSDFAKSMNLEKRR